MKKPQTETKMQKMEPIRSNIPGVSIPNKKILKAKDVKKVLSQLISSFIKGQIKSDEAKSLCYLCQSYITVLQQVDFEERLDQLEKEVKSK